MSCSVAGSDLILHRVCHERDRHRQASLKRLSVLGLEDLTEFCQGHRSPSMSGACDGARTTDRAPRVWRGPTHFLSLTHLTYTVIFFE
jgi:hypothetical protein